MTEITVQVSLDLVNLNEALKMARSAVKAGVDWLEAGTPLILAEGLRSVRALKEEFPRHQIVADLKMMDGGAGESEITFDAGATFVVVMSQAHWATVKEAVTVARRKDRKIMADVLNAPDKVQAAKQMEDLGVDYIVAHLGYDERHHVKGLSALNDLQKIVNAVKIPVQAVGGLSIDQAIESLRFGARSVVIGAPLAIADGSFAQAEEFERILSDVVSRVDEFKSQR